MRHPPTLLSDRLRQLMYQCIFQFNTVCYSKSTLSLLHADSNHNSSVQSFQYKCEFLKRNLFPKWPSESRPTNNIKCSVVSTNSTYRDQFVLCFSPRTVGGHRLHLLSSSLVGNHTGVISWIMWIIRHCCE